MLHSDTNHVCLYAILYHCFVLVVFVFSFVFWRFSSHVHVASQNNKTSQLVCDGATSSYCGNQIFFVELIASPAKIFSSPAPQCTVSYVTAQSCGGRHTHKIDFWSKVRNWWKESNESFGGWGVPIRRSVCLSVCLCVCHYTWHPELAPFMAASCMEWK